MIIPAAEQNGLEGDGSGNTELLRDSRLQTGRPECGGQMGERVNGKAWKWGCGKGGAQESWGSGRGPGTCQGPRRAGG